MELVKSKDLDAVKSLSEETRLLVNRIESLHMEIKRLDVNFHSKYDVLLKDLKGHACSLLEICAGHDSLPINSATTDVTGCQESLKTCLEKICHPFAIGSPIDADTILPVQANCSGQSGNGDFKSSQHNTRKQRCCLNGPATQMSRLLGRLMSQRFGNIGRPLNDTVELVKRLGAGAHLKNIDLSSAPCQSCLYDSHWPSVLHKSRSTVGENGKGKRLYRHVDARLAAEVAYQLDRRMLSFVFADNCHQQQSLYGLSTNTMPEMILLWAYDLETGSFDDALFEKLVNRYCNLMASLSKLGYDECFHPKFCVKLVNKYGLSGCRIPAEQVSQLNLNKYSHLRCLLQVAVPENHVSDMMIVLDALLLLVEADKKPIFCC